MFIHVGIQRWRPENISVRTLPGKTLESIEFIKRKMKEFDPGYELSYNFLDKSLNTMYESERRNQEIITYSTILIFFIASMGLFAQAQHSTLRRRKEIGIRRSIGRFGKFNNFGSIKRIFYTGFGCLSDWNTVIVYLNRELAQWFLLIESILHYLLVILNACITVFIVLLTVFYQAGKIIRINPIEVLRSE